MVQSTDLQTLVVSLEARIDKYTKAMEKAASDTDRVTRGISSQFTKLDRQISSFGRSFLVGFGGLAAIRQFGEAIDKIANIGEIAGRIGISTRALQAMHEMARKTGASLDQVDRGLQSIAEQSAQKGSFLDKLFQANNLKLSTTDTEANLRSLMDLLKNAQSESQRLFIATQVFGDKVGRHVVEAFSQGGDAIDTMFTDLTAKDKAFTDAAIAEATNLRQAYREMASDIETSWEKMALGMVAIAQKVAPELAKMFPGAAMGGESIVKGDWLRAIFGSYADFMRITPEGKLHIGPPEIATPTRGGTSGGFADRLIGAESGGVANAQNPQSTAAGLGQFIESTWLEQFKKVFPQQAATMSRDAILALRANATVNRALIDNYTKENTALLLKAGVAVNDASLYLAHFLGPGGAVDVLKAPPSTPLSGILSQKQIAANGSVLGGGRTAGDLISWAQLRIGMPSAPGAATSGPGAGLSGGMIPGGGTSGAGTTQLPLSAEDAKKLTDQLDVARDAVKGFFGDLIAGLRAGASLTDTLATAFDNLASKFIDQALNQAVALLLGQTGGVPSGFLGNLFGLPQRAGGGMVNAGQPYMVGERGRELFVPDVNGRIVPNGGDSGGGFGVQVLPSKYFDVHVMRISSAGDARTLNSARRSFPGTAARFQKLGTT